MKETQHIEFKESWRDEYLKYVSGFANAQGGSILIGINDSGDVTGINNAGKLLEELPNKINDTTGVIADVNLIHQDDKEFIKIDISPSIAPVTYKGKIYYRSGSTLQELDGVAAQNFLLKKMGIGSWDARIVEGGTLEDIDTEAVNYFVRKGISNGRLAPETREDSVEKILRNLNLITPDGELTIASLLLFGKYPQQYCLNARFRIGRFGNSDAALMTQDIIEGNLIQMVDRVMEILGNKYLIRPIHYEGLQRVEPLEIPEKGLRELLFNSVIHKSYDGPDIQMKVYDDRIILWNYGKLPEGITTKDIAVEHQSIPRNKLIANTFFRAGFIEAWGRGFQKVTESFRKSGLSIPTFREEFGGFTAEIKREIYAGIKRGGQIDENTGVLLNQRNDTKNDTKRLSILTERQRIILGHLDSGDTKDDTKDDTKTTSYLARMTNVSISTIKRDLKVLQSFGFVEHRGPMRGGAWIVKKTR